jgi:hypothetical protein
LATGADKTSATIRFHLTDSCAADGTSPLVKPPSGTDYSYTVTLRAFMDDAPAVQINNICWYMDGANNYGTGVSLYAKNVGTTFVAHYDTAMTGGASAFGYTSVAPLDGDAADPGPHVPADVDTYIGDLIDLQMWVADTVTPGTLSAESITLSWDEV